MIEPRTTARIQLIGAWCGVAYLVLLFGGWGLVAGFLPPIPPWAGADEIAQLFAQDTTRIRIGMVLTMFGALAMLPFAAVVARAISPIEDGPGVLTYTFLLGAAGNMALTFYPPMWWLTAAYRPDRAPELLYVLNDTAWLQFIGGVTIYLAMPLSLMVVALCDKSPDPVFPRWFGYTMGWVALITVPDQMLFFFHSGPFAWSGILGLWIPATMFGVFFIVNTVVIRRAILRSHPFLTGSNSTSPADLASPKTS
jgi:hypothetical protein